MEIEALPDSEDEMGPPTNLNRRTNGLKREIESGGLGGSVSPQLPTPQKMFSSEAYMLRLIGTRS
jgi:hypothetical protein